MKTGLSCTMLDDSEKQTMSSGVSRIILDDEEQSMGSFQEICDLDDIVEKVEAQTANDVQLGQDEHTKEARVEESLEESVGRSTLDAPPPTGLVTENTRPSSFARHRWIIPLSGAAFLCYTLLSSASRPYEVILESRQRSMESRGIFSNHPFSIMRNNNHRMLGNDDDGQNNYYDGNYNYDDAGNGAYYNVTDDATNETYYEEEYYEEEVVDDFYTYIDDSIEIKQIFPLEFADYAGIVCTSLSIILSIGGGIGPGAILVAVFIIVMDFQPKVAIPLSCITGLGVTFLSTLMNMRKRHPLSDRPLIDWDLVLIMEPLTLFGAIAGTYLNKILGQKVLLVLLVLLLSVIAHNTLKKARKMHHAEELYIKRMLWAKQKRRHTQHNILATLPTVKSFDGKLAEADPPFIPKIHPSTRPSTTETRNQPLLANQRHRDTASRGDDSSISDGSYSDSFRSFIVLRKTDVESVKSSLIEEESDPLPQNKITYVCTMFLGVIAFNVFKGGAAFESPLGILCGSVWFWIVELLTTAWLGCCTVLAGRYLLKRHAIKEAVGFDYVRGDIKWDVRTIVIYPSACIVAGLVSGMFGIGCAVLIAPMLVGIGVNPSVAAATCACMNFFTSLAATSSFVVLGSLHIDHQYAIAFFFVGIFSMIVGKWVMSFSLHSTKIKKNKRLERHSYMAYSMGLVVLISALCMTVEALLDVVNHSYDDEVVDGICDIDQIY